MSLIDEITSSRPAADHAIDQFLMKPRDLEGQVKLVGPFLADKKVFFLGDDDHISPLLAHEYGTKPVIYEYDTRILDNLTRWFGHLGIKHAQLVQYDARDPISRSIGCDSFYLNPPYSSKADGLGIKIWLMRALEACKADCSGVLVMPWGDANIHERWTHDIQESVNDFIGKNGLEITRVDENTAGYFDTTDAQLKSSTVYLKRVNQDKVKKIGVGGLYN